MSTETGSLAAALAAVQAELPGVAKGETAVVQTKSGGNYKYSYADLAAVSRAILPRLGAHGLAWITKPTLREDGRFVLAYKLAHASGEAETGEYPLSDRGSPQEIGSAITYARRYALCSVTGVAPDDDDDAAGAQAAHQREQPSSRKRPPKQSDEPPRSRQERPTPQEPTQPLEVIGPAAQRLADSLSACWGRDALTGAWNAIRDAAKAGDITEPESAHLKQLWGAQKQRKAPSVAATKRLHALFNEAGITDRDAKLRYIGDVIGTAVATSKSLDADQVGAVADRLGRYIAQNEPTGAPA